MKPYQHIETVKRLIKDLKKELPYSNNKKIDAKRINTLIDCVNSFDSMLVSKYYTDALEVLILSLYEKYLLQVFIKGGKKIPIYLIHNRMLFNLEFTKEEKRKQIIDLINSIEVDQLLKQNKNSTEIIKDIKNVYKSKDHNEFLDEMINKLRQKIRWTK